MTDLKDNFTVPLFGRYYAFISMLPYLVLLGLFLFTACFFAVWGLVDEVKEIFEIVILPFVLAGAIMIPFLFVIIYILRWHGKRRVECDGEGLTMVLPNKHSVFVPWPFLRAVELRFTKPRQVTITLISAAIRFSFSTLEMNLTGREALKEVYRKGFALDELRGFLYHLHIKAPHLSWRMTQAFKDQFNISHPPYELEKLDFHDLGSDG
ncbi:MAG: hypothetical protein QNK37_09840 [Acidobacteriota bacterium]|nr:hypothetical protein [Acidobacteriota bacterium]